MAHGFAPAPLDMVTVISTVRRRLNLWIKSFARRQDNMPLQKSVGLDPHPFFFPRFEDETMQPPVSEQSAQAIDKIPVETPDRERHSA